MASVAGSSETHPLVSGSSTRALQREKDSLERLACLRKVCIKVTACFCTPLNLCCFCCEDPSVGLSGSAHEKNPDTDRPYSKRTTCSSNRCCWEPARPPENYSDLLLLTCDPFVMCCHCDESGPDNYLIPPERQRMQEVAALLNERSLGGLPLPPEMIQHIRRFVPPEKLKEPPRAEKVPPRELKGPGSDFSLGDQGGFM